MKHEMKHDLIERYIYAATKKLPVKQQADIAQELRTLIADMLEERCGGATPADHDVRVVLTELGTPDELHERYDANGKRCLIGAPYYATYLLVLKIVLACTAFGVTLGAALSLLGPSAAPVYEGALAWFGTLWSGLLEAFAFVTILFAIFYHKGVNLDMTQSLDDLPPVPEKNTVISRGEAIFGIAFSVLFLVVFLGAPQIICAIFSENGAMVTYPVFNVATVRATWYLPAALCILSVARDAVKLFEGCYTKKVLVATLVVNVVSAFLFILWLTNPQLINPAFTVRMAALFTGEGAFLGRLFAQLPKLLLAAILLGLAIDIITAVAKTWRGRSAA